MPVAAFILERIIEETWLKWTERDCSVSRIILIFSLEVLGFVRIL